MATGGQTSLMHLGTSRSPGISELLCWVKEPLLPAREKRHTCCRHRESPWEDRGCLPQGPAGGRAGGWGEQGHGCQQTPRMCLYPGPRCQPLEEDGSSRHSVYPSNIQRLHQKAFLVVPTKRKAIFHFAVEQPSLKTGYSRETTEEGASAPLRVLILSSALPTLFGTCQALRGSIRAHLGAGGRWRCTHSTGLHPRTSADHRQCSVKASLHFLSPP